MHARDIWVNMIEISVKHDLDALARRLQAKARQIPFATAKALSDTARQAAAEVQAAMPRYIDKPTPFTVKSIRWKRATKQTLRSEVFIAPIAAAYLQPLIAGGVERPIKGQALVLAGADTLNQYGNVPRRRIKQLLRKLNTFSGTVRGIGGIWQRIGQGRVKLLLRYEAEQKKRSTFPFPRLVKDSVRRNWNRNFKGALELAMRTAR